MEIDYRYFVQVKNDFTLRYEVLINVTYRLSLYHKLATNMQITSNKEFLKSILPNLQYFQYQIVLRSK